MAGLGYPDFGWGIVAVQYDPHLGQVPIPASPCPELTVPGAREAVEADRRHLGKDAAPADQIQPVCIERTGSAEDDLPAALADPMTGGARHLAEKQPVAVLAPVPVEPIVGLVGRASCRERVCQYV